MQEMDSKQFNDKCPKCGSSNLKQIGGGLYASPLGKSGRQTIYKCNDCGYEFSVVTLNSPVPGPVSPGPVSPGPFRPH